MLDLAAHIMLHYFRRHYERKVVSIMRGPNAKSN
jgi:hypothetical protein